MVRCGRSCDNHPRKHPRIGAETTPRGTDRDLLLHEYSSACQRSALCPLHELRSSPVELVYGTVHGGLSRSKLRPRPAPNLVSIRLLAYSTDGLAPHRVTTANWQYQTDEQASALWTCQHCLSPFYAGHSRVSRNRTPGSRFLVGDAVGLPKG